MRSRRFARRRGGTFTIVVLAMSALIMVTASLFVRASGHAFERAVLETHQVRVREAAFAGLRWAARDAAARPEARLGRATLRLTGGVTAEVAWERGEGDRLGATVRAEGRDAKETVEAELVREGEEYLLAGFRAERR